MKSKKELEGQLENLKSEFGAYKAKLFRVLKQNVQNHADVEKERLWLLQKINDLEKDMFWLQRELDKLN